MSFIVKTHLRSPVKGFKKLFVLVANKGIHSVTSKCPSLCQVKRKFIDITPIHFLETIPNHIRHT